jgi:hypothetical protein
MKKILEEQKDYEAENKNINKKKEIEEISIIKSKNNEAEKQIVSKNFGDDKSILRKEQNYFSNVFNENDEIKNLEEKNSVFNEDENGEIGFILRMYEESKKIRSLFFSSLVGKKKDFQKLKNILGTKIEGIGELLTGEISQGMNKRWIIGWRFNKLVY